MPIALLLLLGACGSGTPNLPDAADDSEYRIGAWNLRAFGPSKASKPELIEHLSQVLRRYDLVLLQEVRDSSGHAISVLLEAVNARGPGDYALLISDPLGRSTYKERYAYLYRQSRVSLLDAYLYEDGREPFDTLMREPLVSLWQIGGEDMILVPNHLPADTETTRVELESLADVLLDATQRWAEPRLLLMGDLNADCRYMPQSALAQSALRQQADLHWLIGDDADTTVRQSTDCAYDRVIASDAIMPWVVSSQASVFHFGQHLALSEAQSLAVSDHYPVELSLRPR